MEAGLDLRSAVLPCSAMPRCSLSATPPWPTINSSVLLRRRHPASTHALSHHLCMDALFALFSFFAFLLLRTLLRTLSKLWMKILSFQFVHDRLAFSHRFHFILFHFHPIPTTPDHGASRDSRIRSLAQHLAPRQQVAEHDASLLHNTLASLVTLF